MSLHTLTDWLTKLLKTRNINPDGRLLFAYDLSDDEYAQLRQELADTMAEASGVETLAAKSLGRAQLAAPPAAFVLYAAEWWKHDYAGGVWDWGPIIESLGGNSDSFTYSPQLRSEFVARGLAFWHLSPLNKGKRFIGSIVVNGGIPMRLLAQGSGSIALILSQVLKLASRYRWGQSQISQAVSERWSQLPAAYQRPEIAELLAQFVVAALHLKDECQLEGVTDPTAQLDRVLPDWRRRFPISLRNEAAHSLLTGLVREVASQRTVAVNGLFVAERRLVRGSSAGQYSIESHVALPNRIPAEDFASLFGLNGVEEIPRHFTIDLLAVARQSCSEGRLIHGADQPVAVINTKKIVSRGQAARSELQLILRSQLGDKGEHCTLEGGGALSEDDPWIFVDGDAGQPVLAAVGGARLPHESVWVALPPAWRVESDAETQEVGELLCPDLVPRKILSLHSNARLIQSSDVYRVLLGQGTPPKQIYQWKAQRLPEASGRAVFRDVSLPRLFRATEDGLQPVPMSAQHWRRPGNQETLVPKDARGPVEVRILDEGELVARQGIFLLPPQARIEYISGNVVGCGQVRFLNWGAIDLAPAVTDGVTAKVTIEGLKSINIDLVSHSTPPAEFMVRVKWPGAINELALTLPYPVTGGRFLHPDGSIMQAQEVVTLRDLIGMRLQIFDTNPSHPKRYEVQLILGHGKNATSSRYPVDLLPGSGRAEVRLLDYQKQIESLLGLFDDQDATVRVLLLVGGQPSSEIRVGRYTTSLQKDENSVRVSTSSMGLVSPDLLDETTLLASSLIQPGTDSLVLAPFRSEGVHTGAWAAEGMKSELAPWLIFPAENSEVLFRPLLWVESAAQEEDVDLIRDTKETADADLRLAMQRAQADERRKQLHSTLVSMSGNHSHESWPLLDSLWEKFHHLPLTTLDVWRMLSKQPKAMVSFLLRSQLEDIELAEAIRRFRAETAWVPELTTVSDLCEVAQAFWHFWTQQGLDEKRCQKFFKDALEGRLELLVNEIPSLRPLIETVVFAATGTVSDLLVEVAGSDKKTTQNFHRQMWDGVDSLVNTQLFLVNEGRDSWPRRDFVEKQALPAFLDGFPSEQAQILRPHLDRMFWGFGTWAKYFGTQFDTRHQPDFKFSVVNLPVVCALWAATSTSRQWWGDDPGSRLALKQIRDFDPVWFEQAYRQAFKICMSIEGLVQLPHITGKRA